MARIGKIYTSGDPDRFVEPKPPSQLRETVTLKLAQMKAEAFDRDAELAVDALIEAMEWHKPWQFWTQMFRPTYVGDRYEGPGCRSCGTSPSTDCMTVRGIAMKLGVLDR